MDFLERIPVPVSTRAPTGRTNAYLLGSERAVLVDPADRHERVDAALADRDPAHLLLTHTHPDHVCGVPAYAESATVWTHTDHRDDFVEATGVEPDRTFGDGTTVRADRDVEVLETPGHAPDHVALAFGTDTGTAIVCGDLAVAEGSVVVGGSDGDMRDYLDSLRRLRELEPDRLYPGHGPVVDDPDPVLSRLIDHRLDRERRVLEAVTSGAETPSAVTDAAYDKDLAGVRDLAEATVVAHLEKLADEGAITFDGERALPA
jgi:ribonuclease/clavin/mitogillin